MYSNNVALVTGANRGIGLEICRQLIEKNIFVILTSRDEEKGKMAASNLDSSGNKVIFHQLDVADFESISRIVEFVQSRYSRLDILINNAGILIDENTSALNISMDIVQKTLDINFKGPFKLIQSFLPIMKKNNYGRIVNISSGMGAFSEMGGGYAAYRISKTALNAMTKIIASELSDTNILINSMCPGWVRTEMGGSNANRSVEKGADTAIWLATQPDGSKSGNFYRDNKVIDW
jgi:NAD(P)-dependent dehydrogenase (short-subunit alcohol dehydrogenase family)